MALGLALIATGACSGVLTAPAKAGADLAKDVEAKCLEAAASKVTMPRIVVDPHGSDHYGLAVVGGKRPGESGGISLICVYDRASRTVELGGPIANDKLLVGQ
ncbi:hypothetical protein BWR60_25985 [Inquilinus limosus]|uniref:Uncharacterized protein n=2 Tax=Inquilinus limosus TaxID=171674 RepID=A0A211ZG19_9PROT|nr:hypothetical protein BWR60_25985 [Inquilinus limosus]